MVPAVCRGLLLFVSLVAAASAQAQEGDDDPELGPVYVNPGTPGQTVDKNGIDLATGRFVGHYASLSIGSGDTALRWSDGADDLTRARLLIQGSSYFVSIGDITTEFLKQDGGDFVPLMKKGETLQLTGNDFIYTNRFGDQLMFRLKWLEHYQIANTPSDFLPVSLRRHDGLTVTFNYDSGTTRHSAIRKKKKHWMRLGSLSTTNGYVLRLLYGQSELPDTGSWTMPWFQRTGYAIGRLADGCGATSGVGCLRQVSVDADGSVTDAAGQRTTVTRADGKITVRLPGSTSDDEVIAGEGSVTVTKGGVTTSYSRADNEDLTHTMTVVEGDLPARRYVFSETLFNLLREEWQAERDGPVLTRSYEYDLDSGLLLRVTEPEGNSTKFSYDGRGNVVETRIVSKTPGTPADIVTSATYPTTCDNPLTCNQPLTTTDARGGVTDYRYDPVHGGVLSVTRPAADPAQPGLRATARYDYTEFDAHGAAIDPTPQYDGDGNLIGPDPGVWLPTRLSVCATRVDCAGTVDETVTTLSYGEGLDLASITRAAGGKAVPGDAAVLSATTSFAYDAVGDVIAADGPLAGPADTVRTRYDLLRRPTGTVLPDPDGDGPRAARATRVTYNADGSVASVEQGRDTTPAAPDFEGFTALQRLDYGYDGYHRPVRQALAMGGTTYALSQQSYDGYGRPECSVTRLDPAQWDKATDACAPQTGPKGADRVVRRGYDLLGRVGWQTSGYGSATPSTERTSYSANGAVAVVTDGDDHATAYARDGFDRPWRSCYAVASVAECAAAPSDYRELRFADSGDLSGVRLRDGRELSFGYDGLGRRATVTFVSPTGASDATTRYGYDLLDRVVSVSDAAGERVGYAYDALGRVVGETGASGTLRSDYDAGDRRERLTWGDGFFVRYGYDATGALTTVTEDSGHSLASYDYDDLGRRTRRLLGNGANTTYDYGGTPWLRTLGVAGVSIGFDTNAVGQIAGRTLSDRTLAYRAPADVTRGYGVNALNEYTRSGAVVPSYDARGNLTSAHGAYGGDRYAYDLRDRLVAAGPDGAAADRRFGYDPLGRLDRVEPAGLAWEWDGAQLVTERRGGAVVARYVPGAGADEPLVWYDGADRTGRRWLEADERGSVVRVSDDANATVALNRYDDWGVPKRRNLGRFQYTGQMWLPELRFYYDKARLYSPTLGRFLQPDPIGYEDGRNWYAYVGGDPVNVTDPSGLCGYPGEQPCEDPDQPDVVMPGARDPGVKIGTDVSFDSSIPIGESPDVVVIGRREAPQTEQRMAAKMSEDEQEVENEKDEVIRRIVRTRECWASAAVRRGRRAAGQPVPPPNLQTGTKPGWSSRNIVNGVEVIGVVGSVICILAEPCGAAVATGLGLGGAAALLSQ